MGYHKGGKEGEADGREKNKDAGFGIGGLSAGLRLRRKGRACPSAEPKHLRPSASCDAGGSRPLLCFGGCGAGPCLCSFRGGFLLCGPGTGLPGGAGREQQLAAGGAALLPAGGRASAPSAGKPVRGGSAVPAGGSRGGRRAASAGRRVRALAGGMPLAGDHRGIGSGLYQPGTVQEGADTSHVGY